MFRDRTGLVGGPLCGFLRHFAACYTVIQPVIHPCLGLSLKEWKDAGRERTRYAVFSSRFFFSFPFSGAFIWKNRNGNSQDTRTFGFDKRIDLSGSLPPRVLPLLE